MDLAPLHQYFIDILYTTIPAENSRALLSLFAFTNSLITFVLTSVISRPAMARERGFCLATLMLLWCAIVPGLADVIQEPPPVKLLSIPNPGIRLGSAVWLSGFVLMMRLIQKILFATRNGSRLLGKLALGSSFAESKNYRFGLPFMDKALEGIWRANEKFYYPILLVAEINTKGLRLAQRFLAQGMKDGEGGIYLTFTRPASIIRDQMLRRLDEVEPGRDEQGWQKRCVIIDGYSTLYAGALPKYVEASGKWIKVIPCDPRDPVSVGRAYKKALRAMRKHVPGVRSVYDSLTDFLSIADVELVLAYMRHMIVFEGEQNIKALYVLWPEVLKQPLDDKYLAWFCNTTLYLNKSNAGHSVKLEGVGGLSSPLECNLDGNLDEIAAASLVIQHQGEKHTVESAGIIWWNVRQEG